MLRFNNEDLSLLEEMLTEIDVVDNLAATTDFDESFVQQRREAVGGRRFFAGQVVGADLGDNVDEIIEAEAAEALLVVVEEAEDLVEESGLAEENKAAGGLEAEFLLRLVEEGDDPDGARKFGWPNTYVFTKAMGEMLLGQLKENENIPIVIIRPTIVTSTYKEPFPGWVEGVSLAVGYGKGKTTCFLGDLASVVDVIPADMVVKCRLPHRIVGVKSAWRQSYGQRHFTSHPWIDRNGSPVVVGNVTVFNTMKSFRHYDDMNM
ncbi:hypothetical protein SASPL_122139 [Salvia splendens]|uniref:Fatty acyl-CoA reductase n=1 Tax=Salvia splendens TaxID=180675 RepID=A0A8X8XHP4_SALSN|nr:hypothetical protein SASPL_122139 [Salvia splendens]